MSVAIKNFGTLSTGKSVQAVTLSNEILELVILDFGLRVVSLRYKPQNQQLVMGNWPIERYEFDSSYLGAVVGRTCNRIADARFQIGEQIYSLDANEGMHHLHGGTNSFHNRLWQLETNEHQIRAKTHSPDGENGYPGNLSIEVVIRLEGNVLTYEYSAETDQDTYCDLTNHTYFCLDDSGSILDHELQMAADAYLPVDDTLIPTGEKAKVTETPFDFRHGALLTDRLSADHPQLTIGQGIDHCLLLKEQSEPPVNLYSKHSGMEMRIRTSAPAIQLYTGNYLDSPNAALCLETQHLPNACNQPGFDAPLVTPDLPYESRTDYMFSNRNDP